MLAKDVMTTKVITVREDTVVKDVAALLLKHRISGVPVVDDDRKIVGIVSEGDLLRRVENDTEHRHSWWLENLFFADARTDHYIKAHARKVSDVMTRNVVTVTEETPLFRIADVLEKHHIKRVPVVRDGELIGIVSRANLLHGLAAQDVESVPPGSVDDQTIRAKLLETLSHDAGIDTSYINVIVTDGAVQLWGVIASTTDKKAAEVAAENVPGVLSVENNLTQLPGWMWAE